MLAQILIIQVLTFAGLIFILRILFYKHLKAALKRLEVLHAENLAREEQLKKELIEAQLKSQQELAAARKEAERIIQEARQKASKVKDELEDKAKQSASRIVEDTKQELENKEKEMELLCVQEAVNLAAEVLGAAFAEGGRQVLQQQLVFELIDELSRMSSADFNLKSKEVTVFTASALNPEERDKLRLLLSKKSGEGIELKEELDSSLIGGIVIKSGSLVIDASLKNKLKKVVEYLKRRKKSGA